jgi:hypothetical protein
MKKYRITQEYSDVCFFRKVVEIRANSKEKALKLFDENGEDAKDCRLIYDEMIEQKNDRDCYQTEIEEINK